MNNKYFAYAILIVFSLSCAKSIENAEDVYESQNESVTYIEECFVPGIQAVYFSEDMASFLEKDLKSGVLMTKSSPLALYDFPGGIRSMRRIFPFDERFEKRTRKCGLHRWYYVEYDNSYLAATKASESFAGMPGVEYSEPVRRTCATEVLDPGFNKQWALYQPNGFDLNVKDVWENYTSGKSDVIVAVIDSGVSLDHEDLSANTMEADIHKSRNFVVPGYVIHPDDHGTHVAGIIAASRNNGIGIAGIAGGDAAKDISGVKIMSCQIFDTNSSGESISGGEAEAIKYAADNGAVICQNSWGYNFDTNKDGKLTGDELTEALSAKIDGALRAAVDYFIEFAGCDNDGNQLPESPMKGGIVIFAAGNDNIANGAPANYDKILSVSSVTMSGMRSPFSNYGDWVDICAPGSEIYSTVVGGYQNSSGTSMACPQVSGIAALVVSYRGGQGFTNDDLWQCLVKGARPDCVSSTVPIGPFADALGSVVYGISTPPEEIPALTLSASSNCINAKFSINETNPAYGVNVYLSKTRDSIESLDPLHPSADVMIVRAVVSQFEDKANISLSINDLEFETEYFATAVAFNYGPSYGTKSSIVSIRTGRNNSPVITTSIPVDNIILRPSQYINFQVLVSDPDGHSVKMEVETGSKAESWLSDGQGYKVTINAAQEQSGSYVSRFKATDKYGLSSLMEVHYTILENEAPKIVKQINDILLRGNSAKAELRLDEYFVDPDGDVVLYDVRTTSPDIIHASVSEGILYITVRGFGVSEIEVIAKDPSGDQVKQSFKVLARDTEIHSSVYPNPAQDFISIATDELATQTEIAILSQTGKEVFHTVENASAFNPARIDLTRIAPGRYSVIVKFNDNTYVHPIVKL